MKSRCFGLLGLLLVTSAASAAPKPVRPERRCFGVLERSHDTVVIDGGLEEGLFVGTRLRGEPSHPDEAPVVVAVLRPGKGHAEVDFQNNQLPLGLLELCRTKEPLRSERFLPRRVWPLSELELVLRPYAMDRLALWTQASAGYRGRDWHLFSQLDLGLTLDGQRSEALGAQLFGGYDARAFELALGAGVGAASPPYGGVGYALMGPAFGVLTRVGALDGSSLTLWGSVVAAGEPVAALFGVQLQLTLGTGLWLRPRFALGRAGYQHGELGLRVRVAGNGSAGSVALLLGAGLVGWGGQLGPSGALGLELRL